MAAENTGQTRLEIAHVLFIDIVGYSKLLTNEQRQKLEELNRVVRETEQFRSADASGKLMRLPTGDGMVLVFFTRPDDPVRCAIAISRSLGRKSDLPLRMGIHSGPVDQVSHVDDRPNLAGAGVNIAQRVMNCGDAGHILLSARAANDLAEYGEWKAQLHPLGEVEVKHGVRLGVVSLHNDEIGNPGLPDKIKQAEQERAASVVRSKKKKRRRIILIASAAVLLLLGVGLGSWIWQRRVALTSAYKLGAAGIVEKSVAVLPFEYFGSDKNNAYLADGVQDDILTNLANVADLKVISRRSVAQFRDTKQTVREIGQALQVAYVLEGTVRKVAGKISVTAQLIDTRTEAEKWAQKYDRDFADIFAIQNEISETIADQLKATLSPAEKNAIETMPTHDMQAYDLYLRARTLVHTFGTYAKQREENRAKAKPLLEAAIARDPKFVLAYCLLAEAECSNEAHDRPAPDTIARARNALDTALKLAPESGEVHLQLGFFYRIAVDDLEHAKQEFTIAVRKLPNSVLAYSALAELEQDTSNWREALQHSQRAAELDPRDPGPASELAGIYTYLRRYDEAEKVLDRMIPIVPFASSAWIWWHKGQIEVERGNTKAAMAAYDSSPLRRAGTTGLNRRIAHVLLLERRYDEAVALMSSIEKTARANDTIDTIGFSDWDLARIYLELGIVRRAQGKPELARSAFEIAKAKFIAWQTKRSTENTLDYQAVCDAGLGNKEAALRQVRQLQELSSKSSDPGEFISAARWGAVVYAWCGDRETALGQLEAIVHLPQSLDPGDLKLNPQWDELRQEPRFQKLILEASKPVNLN